MVKRGHRVNGPQASEGEAQHGAFCWTGRLMLRGGLRREGDNQNSESECESFHRMTSFMRLRYRNARALGPIHYVKVIRGGVGRNAQSSPAFCFNGASAETLQPCERRDPVCASELLDNAQSPPSPGAGRPSPCGGAPPRGRNEPAFTNIGRGWLSCAVRQEPSEGRHHRAARLRHR